MNKYKGTSKITGSPTADRRAAIVDYFKNEATIMIATEAAAEGINLQFCSLIVNYDMPWNPQRIEQRIGRCHRYGQKFDVVVINFLNKSNAADIRVYELLDQKFQLFNGVFGASDEVLGSIGNGVDFEKRIAQIYNDCRTPDEIAYAFDCLQAELQEQISEKMIKARSALLENFDDSVKEKLRDNLAESRKNLNLFEKNLWLLVHYALRGKAEFNQDEYSFRVINGEYAGEKFTLEKGTTKVDDVQPFRMGHPLAKEIISLYKAKELESGFVEFHYSETEGKMKLLDELVSSDGYMLVEKISIDSFEQEDHLVIACLKQDGSYVYSDIAERMLSIPAEIIGNEAIDNSIQEKLQEKISEMQNEIVSKSAERNSKFFDEEMDKLDNWADDMKLGLEKEISDLDQEIRLRKSEAKKITRLDEKVSAQRAIKELEKKRTEKRQNLYEAQDEIDEKKDMLLDKIEKMLKQKVSRENLFLIRWRLR